MAKAMIDDETDEACQKFWVLRPAAFAFVYPGKVGSLGEIDRANAYYSVTFHDVVMLAEVLDGRLWPIW